MNRFNKVKGDGVPRGTPADAVSVLSNAVDEVLDDPVVKQRAEQNGTELLRKLDAQAFPEFVRPDGDAPAGAHRLGIQTMAEKAIQSRGVLLDLYALCGDTRQYVGYDLLMRALDATGGDIQSGDMLCLYTGFADKVLAMAGKPDLAVLDQSCAVLDGRDERLRQWIVDSGIAAVCADNYAVEGIPASPAAEPCARLPLHQLCLFRYGIPLGELWYFAELARALADQGRSRFLLTAPPLRLPGAVGSPVTPVATL